MNHTKWEEIRMAMIEKSNVIRWRTKDLITGYVSEWDAEWFYHFRLGGYDTIEWLEIETVNSQIKDEIIKELKKIHAPGIVMEKFIMIYGYKKDNDVNYIE